MSPLRGYMLVISGPGKQRKGGHKCVGSLVYKVRTRLKIIYFMYVGQKIVCVNVINAHGP